MLDELINIKHKIYILSACVKDVREPSELTECIVVAKD